MTTPTLETISRYVIVPADSNDDHTHPRIVLVDRLDRVEYRFLDTLHPEHRSQFYAWIIEQVHTHAYGYLSRPIGTYQSKEI